MLRTEGCGNNHCQADAIRHGLYPARQAEDGLPSDARRACFGHDVDFKGRRVQVVQVGLGTNSTFIQNLSREWDDWSPNINWLMEALSETRPRFMSGVGVEPVAEHAHAMQMLAKDDLPQVAVAQVALGNNDKRKVSMHVLTQRKHDEVMEQAKGKPCEYLERDLLCLRNMTCVGDVHPLFEDKQAWLRDYYGIEISLEEVRTEVWSYRRLSQTLNFRGCELLIVDTEGRDAMILRSMLQYCRREERKGRDLWPYIIQFETMGHCDKLEGHGTEWSVIGELERVGYVLLSYSNHNTQLAFGKAIQNHKRIRAWAEKFECAGCKKQWVFPFIPIYDNTEGMQLYCKVCLYEE